jgi:hypothetical protein
MKEVVNDFVNSTSATESEGVSRRRFIGSLGVAVSAIGAAPLIGGKAASASAAAPADGSGSPGRMNSCFAYRRDAAIASRVNNGSQSGNGDLARYTDYSGVYSKGLLHDALGIPNAAAAASLLKAFQTGKQSDFNSIIVGTPSGGGNSKLKTRS